MPRWLGFTIFFSLVLAILAGLHLYLWARLVRDTQVVSPWRQVGTAALLALALSIPMTFLTMRATVPGGRALAWTAFSWMGFMFLLFVVLLVVDVGRLAAWIAARLGETGTPDPARRTFLARAFGGSAAAIGAAVGAYGMRVALGPVTVRTVEVPLRRLPASKDGFVIAQLTDVHVGPMIGRAFIEDIVRRTNAIGADLIAITGDLVDGSVQDLRDSVAPLANLRARHGVHFITGNHEYYSGVGPWLEELRRLGMRVLVNERVTIDGDGPDGFDLAGVNDWSAARGGGPEHRADLAKALAGRDDNRELVLLAHQPRHIDEAAAHGVGLQLSGHTHGGQIWPFSYLVRLGQPYIQGLHKHGDTHIYVSPGTGYWGPPMRVATVPEITRLVLRRTT